MIDYIIRIKTSLILVFVHDSFDVEFTENIPLHIGWFMGRIDILKWEGVGSVHKFHKFIEFILSLSSDHKLDRNKI